jgi:hypothetical protein
MSLAYIIFSIIAINWSFYMSNYLIRKKTLMGKNYEIEVPLEQYGGDVVRVHAIPDLQLARIEDLTGYKLEDALGALSSQNLTPDEVEALKNNTADEKLVQKGAKALSPKLTLFLGELCKAGIVPNPDCACKKKGCEECDVAAMVEEFRGFSVLMVGMAIIGASTASWAEVETFFLAQKVKSGAV